MSRRDDYRRAERAARDAVSALVAAGASEALLRDARALLRRIGEECEDGATSTARAQAQPSLEHALAWSVEARRKAS